MEDTAMDVFCNSTFWNSNETWYTENPELSPCFQNTVLVWIPCLFLWVFSPLETYYILHSKTRNIPWNWLNITKLVLTVVLVILATADLGRSVHLSANGESVSSADFYSPIIKIATFSFSGVLVVYNRVRGMRTSGLLFLFWFLLALCGAVRYRYELTVTNIEQEDRFFSFVSYMIYYPLVLAMLIFNCFADAPPRFSEYPLVERPCPEQGASFLSKLFFAWFDALAWRGFRKPLETKDLWNMNPEDTASEVIPAFDKYWEKTLRKTSNVPSPKASFRKTSGNVDFVGGRHWKKQQASVLPALCRAFGPTLLFGSFLKLVQDIMIFISPQILKLLISFVEGKESLWKGYLYAILIFVAASAQTLVLAQYFNRMLLVGLRIRTALIAAIYRKALRMSNTARKESTVGEIVNLMSVDAQRFVELTAYLNMIWSAPLQIALALYFLWDTLGPSVLAGLAVMIILIPVNAVIANRVKTLQIRQMKSKDERVKLMNEVLSGIKVLKLYAWEPSFEQQILKIREKEIAVLKQAAYLNASTSFIWSCAPFLVSLASLATYVLVDPSHVLDAEKAFVSLSLFNIIRMPISVIPFLIITLVQASVSIKRVNRFMNSEELDPNSVQHDQSEKNHLVIENGNFSWGSEDQVILRNINLSFKQGSLVAVVGTVGSGKSSLISAFLGEMDKITGRVNTKGSIAYVPQQAWIQNATLLNNIIFGKSLDHSSYQRIIEACALKPDLEMLPASDQTEIGEKGINLSGGQKQRVSLARAVYNNADIYFLDDPLSAVDSHVGKHIFENVIGPSGILRRKTRVLVTHGITYLPDVDMIVVLKDGEVTEMGTYKQLLEKKGAFAEFLVQHLQEIGVDDGTSEADLDEIKQQLENTIGTEELQQKLNHARSRASESQSDSASLSGEKQSLTGSLNRQHSVESSTERGGSRHRLNSLDKDTGSNSKFVAKPNGDKLIEAEKTETGSVKWHVYTYYLKSIGIFLSGATIFFNLVFQAFSIGSNVWLSEWSNDKNVYVNETVNEGKRDLYLGVYGALGAGQALSVFVHTLTNGIGGLKAAKLLHQSLLENLMRLPVSTFFDVTPIGRILARFSSDVNVVDAVLPHLFHMWFPNIFRVVATLVVISYSTPIFISVIIPIGIIYYFIQRFYVSTSRQLKRLESVSRSPVYSHFGESITGAQTIRAYNVQQRFIRESEERVDFNQVCYYPSIIANRWLAVRLEMVGNLIIFFASLFAVLNRDTMSPGLVGLSVSYALQITQTLNWLVRMTSDVETNIVAVERIKEYGETEQEAPWDIPTNQPSSAWPEKGQVEFKDYQVRYREGLDLVLRGISFTVKGGEKVGIVGRTGAGKSSLTLGLFRIIEAAGGKILIDGVDVSKLGLHALRSRLTIIPQDPVLFSGTLRVNLDPFGSCSDSDIWLALEHAHLKAFVKALPDSLEHSVSEGGENLSVGQRQLICLARALLRKTKVLILDEATAAVDLETDDLIQTTIRSEFKDSTVLTIAHRLNTIMDSDRVIVLDRGLLVEYDTPEALLQNKDSIFHSMAKDAGLV
ncbi:multidrug resistance-associated protein 1 isoform X2 [Zootermopsis nevadensis]|uniref:multidrug resistance-associated protein 1 isoform X2 n=1 Tax=Zootermopsis nevadensis TaxID=136037 RepID=UPI000B8ED315|nr:multidrug resistance-associated protein 1 isoform X2 [Zootermopsis nevadensis]